MSKHVDALLIMHVLAIQEVLRPGTFNIDVKKTDIDVKKTGKPDKQYEIKSTSDESTFCVRSFLLTSISDKLRY